MGKCLTDGNCGAITSVAEYCGRGGEPTWVKAKRDAVGRTGVTWQERESERAREPYSTPAKHAVGQIRARHNRSMPLLRQPQQKLVSFFFAKEVNLALVAKLG